MLPAIFQAAKKPFTMHTNEQDCQQVSYALKGHGFSRAARSTNGEFRALARGGMDVLKHATPPRLKPKSLFPGPTTRLKPRPFKVAFAATLLLTGLTVAAGCHSYHVDTTVENRTGAPIQLLEVDYPSASFGADKLDAGAVFHYRIQLRGSGPLKVQYAAPESHQVQIDGPTVAERQEGTLQIILLPGGKAEFHPQLTPAL
jgi:hypothetical protein